MLNDQLYIAYPKKKKTLILFLIFNIPYNFIFFFHSFKKKCQDENCILKLVSLYNN